MPCEGIGQALDKYLQKELLQQLNNWEIIDEHHLFKSYKFEDFASALKWVNEVGELAEKEGHHPDIYLSWGKVDIKIWTHALNGLTENDFVLAAKIDSLYEICHS